MRISFTVLGTEVFALELAPRIPHTPSEADGTHLSRHSGDFGFGTSPAEPHWGVTGPNGPPAIARGCSS